MNIKTVIPLAHKTESILLIPHHQLIPGIQIPTAFAFPQLPLVRSHEHSPSESVAKAP